MTGSAAADSVIPAPGRDPDRRFRLHLESGRKRNPLFHLTQERWDAAARRHPDLAARLDVTVGWDGEMLDQVLPEVDFMINSTPPRENLARRAPKLRWIQTTGAGIDPLMPLDWLPRKTFLTNNTGAHGAKAEDSCAMALLMLNSRMPEMLTNQRERRWKQIYTSPIKGKTAVVLGFGDLGQGAGRAGKKLGLEVIAVTRSGKAARPADRTCATAQLDEVLPTADFLVVTTPLTPETQGLVDRRRLDLLKPGAGLINIGRAPIVDYAALVEKLAGGEISGAVLDVFDEEPLPPESPLWTTPNLVITPHVSCDEPGYIDALLDFWFENFARLLAGKRLKNVVDRRLGY